MKLFEDIINHRSYANNLSSCEIKAWKEKEKSGLNGIQTYDTCDAGAVLYQLSYQVNSVETLRFSRNKFHCSPRDQSLSVKETSTLKANGP